MTSQFLNEKRYLPELGIGLGLRRELAAETVQNADKIDWLEITPENYMNLGGAAQKRLEKAAQCFPLVSHGVNLSLGSTDELSEDYLQAIKTLLDSIDAPWWSDHLCFASFGGTYMHDLLPLPYTKEAVAHISNRIRIARERIGRPLLIENISYYMNIPGSEMTEAQFLAEILERSDCGLLLDVNNVYVNSVNHRFDAEEYLNQLPLERTVQIHVAGHTINDGRVIDTHGAAVIEPVYELLATVLKKTDVKAVMLERDQHFPAFAEILSELNQIRSIARDTQPKLANLTTRSKGLDTTIGSSFLGSEKGCERVGALSA